MIKSHGLGGTLQLQCHDELVLRVPVGFDVTPIIHAMEHPFKVPLLVPLPVDWHLVERWSEAK